eukprot:TRINITY_DN7317_c0_g1_i1.p1 TRINITY_DN7317_c0_g1~~TRINITY_DN7317_c0_g1_i1.p1  ORF type:complete len:253 (-),score=85.70 TRINITY_DN7317_c0_g1_i1:106-864(-)
MRLPSLPSWLKFWPTPEEEEEPKASPPPSTPLPFLIWLNLYVIKGKDCIHWKSPRESFLALVALQVIYCLAHLTSPLSMAALTALAVFSHYTIRVRLWSTISTAPEPLEPAHLEGFGDSLREAGRSLIRLRTVSPGFFLISSLFSFLLLFYLGSLLSGQSLLLLVSLGLFGAPLYPAAEGIIFTQREGIPLEFDLPENSLESYDALEPKEPFEIIRESSLLPDALPSSDEDEEDPLLLGEEDFFPILSLLRR